MKYKGYLTIIKPNVKNIHANWRRLGSKTLISKRTQYEGGKGCEEEHQHISKKEHVDFMQAMLRKQNDICNNIDTKDQSKY